MGIDGQEIKGGITYRKLKLLERMKTLSSMVAIL